MLAALGVIGKRAAGKRRLLPYLLKPDGTQVSSMADLQDTWTRHFAAQEIAAFFGLEQASAYICGTV